MKKSLCVILATIFALAFLGGCQSASSGATESPEGTNAQAANTESATTVTPTIEPTPIADELLGIPGEIPIVKKPFTVKVFTHQDINAIPSNDLLIYKTAQEYLGITIEWETVPDADCKNVLTTRLAANIGLPDLICMYNLGMSDIEGYGKNGIIKEITDDMISQNAPNLAKFYSDNPDAKLSRTTADGKMYSLPDSVQYRKEWQINFMINDPWMKALNLEVPKTTDDLYTVLKAFKENDPNKNGQPDEIPFEHLWSSIDYMVDSWDLHSLEGSHSTAYGFMPHDDGSVTCDFTDPRLKDYFTYMHKLYQDGLLDKEFSTNTMDSVAANVKNQKVGAIIEWTSFSELYDASLIEDYFNQANVIYPVIAQPVAGPQYKGDRFMRPSSGGNWSISASAERPDVLIRMIDAVLFNPKMMELSTYGVEGKTFNKENDKYVRLVSTDEFTKMGGGQWGLMNRQNGWDDICGPKIASDKQYGRPSYDLEPFPIVSPTASEDNTIKKYSGDVTSYFSEMRSKFIIGTEDLSKFDDYVQEIKKRGADELLKVYQAEFDRYNSLSK